MRDSFISEEVPSLDQLNCLAHVGFALFEHPELLEAKRHVVVRDEGKKSVSPRVLQVKDLKNALVLLE